MLSIQRSHLLLALALTAALTMAVGSFALPAAHAPTAPTSAVVTPANPTALSNLQVLASGSTDADGDAVTYQYQWQSKAPAGSWTDLVGENASTLSHPPLHRDWQYRVLVWAVSGAPELQSATSKASNVVTVLNSAPSAPASLAIAPENPVISDNLQATYAGSTDANGDTLTYTVQWALSTDGGFTWGEWGQDGATLPTGSFVGGQMWRARIRAFDGAEWGLERVSASVVIGNTLPIIKETPRLAPTAPTSATDLRVLKLTTGTDADGDPVTFKYQWARSVGGGESKFPLSWGEWEDGESVLPHARLTRGDQWKAQVAPFDGTDYGKWKSSAAVTILNSAPTAPTAVVFDPTTPQTGDAITATATGATDLDGDVLTAASYQYRWLRSTDGHSFLPTAFADAVLPPATTLSGESWKVETWAADDLGGQGAHFTSAAVLIGNRAPSVPSVALTPLAPKSKDNLQALATGGVDPEGVTPLTYPYRWLRSLNGGATWTVVSNPDGATLAAARLKRGEMWKVQARAFDGQAYSPWATSEVVTIGNTVPDTTKLTLGITPRPARVTDTLQGYASGATDFDGDDINYQFQWAVSGDGGVTWSKFGYTRQALTGVTLVVGQTWKLRVRAGDGLGWSAWRGLKTVSIVGVSPTAPTQVQITPAMPGSGSDLTATATGSGTGATYEYQWASSTNGGLTWSVWGNAGAMLDHSLLQLGQSWKAQARALAGGLSSGWVQSAAVTILNAAPTAPTVVIAPLAPIFTNQDLTATAQSTDADGDSLTYEYQWSRSTNGGTTWSAWSWTGPTLLKAVTETRDLWRVQARATDGKLFGDWAAGDPVEIFGMFADQDPEPNAAAGPRDYLTFGFVQPVNQASAQSAFTLTTAGGTPVAGTFRWTTPHLVMRFVPTAPLAKATLHTVTMAGGVALVGGGQFDWTETFSFTTSSAPVVMAATPTGSGVPTGSAVTVTFDQNMKAAATVAAFSITPAVVGSAPTLSGNKLTFTPMVGFAANTLYTVTVAATARSKGNLPMHDSYTWTFTTAAAAPVSMSAAAARTAAGAQINVNLSAAASVRVVICNIAGYVVAELPGRALPAGVSTLLWNGRSLAGTAVPSGVYLVRVEGNSADGARTSCLTTLRQ